MAEFLVDASLPRSTADLIRSRGSGATDVRDIGLGSASDESIAAHARLNQLCIITRDWDFGDTRVYPPGDYHGIVVIGAPPDAGRVFVLRMVNQFLLTPGMLDQIAGHLVVVEPHRIRVRPA